MRLEDGAFCYEVTRPGSTPSGSSLRYTLICLLGLQRAKAAGLDVPIDPDELRDLVMDRIDEPEMTAGDLALLMWADSRAGMGAMDAIAFRLHKKLGAELPDLEGLELSWLVIGAAEAGAYELCDRALERQLERASAPGRLFTHRDSGRRARFPNFATQIYGVLALAIAARNGHAHGPRARRPAASPVACSSSSAPTAAGRGSSTRSAARSSSPTRSTPSTRTRWRRWRSSSSPR